MAAIVGAVGTPHTPSFVELPDPHPTVLRYRAVADRLHAMRPDILVLFDCDHLNAFFLDNLPTFAIGAATVMTGPCDPLRTPRYAIPGIPDFGRELHRQCLAADFDPALSQELTVDHSVVVPLHFLTPDMRIPVVPVFVNGFAENLPSAARCHAFGRVVGGIVRALPEHGRVALVASGSFSLEVGGPRIRDHLWHVPARPWAQRVAKAMTAGDLPTLLELTSRARLAAAGNAAGETLAWITMLGALDGAGRGAVALEPGQGHGFGVWEAA